MKKDFGFFIIVDIVFLAVSVWFFIVSGLFHVDSETNLWFAATYILTTLCVVVFLPSAGFLNIRPLERRRKQKNTSAAFQNISCTGGLFGDLLPRGYGKFFGVFSDFFAIGRIFYSDNCDRNTCGKCF